MRTRRLFSRLASLFLALAGLWLVVFHAALLWKRIADASIVQPEVLVRWAGAAALVAIFAIFRRHARDRRATLVFWLLVAFLHLGIPADERLFVDDGQLAALVEVGLAATAAALLTIALLTADDALRLGSASLVFEPATPKRDRERAARHGRSPPIS